MVGEGHALVVPVLIESGKPDDLHLVRRGHSAQDEPEERYDIYVIDYGAYVDLSHSKYEPEGTLPSGAEADGGYVDVPTQDLRAIRRAVLDLEEFAEGEAAAVRHVRGRRRAERPGASHGPARAEPRTACPVALDAEEDMATSARPLPAQDRLVPTATRPSHKGARAPRTGASALGLAGSCRHGRPSQQGLRAGSQQGRSPRTRTSGAGSTSARTTRCPAAEAISSSRLRRSAGSPGRLPLRRRQ
jgi:hypothetical protein